MMSNDYAFWDADLYDLPSVYDTAFDLDKAARLAYHESAMTHAMLFTGPRGVGATNTCSAVSKPVSCNCVVM